MSSAVYVVTVVLEMNEGLPIHQLKQHIQDAINDGSPEPLMWRLKTNRVTQISKLPAGEDRVSG